MTIYLCFIIVPLYSIITNTTKWKQDGITVFQQFDFDESSFDLNSMYIDEDETIYLTEIHKDHVIELKLNATNFPVVAGGIGEGTHQLWVQLMLLLTKQLIHLLFAIKERDE